MKCKFKSFSNECLCQVLNGECQFIKSHYGLACPIYHSYVLWDKYILEQLAKNDPDNIAHVENIATADTFDDTITTECVVDILDIITTE